MRLDKKLRSSVYQGRFVIMIFGTLFELSFVLICTNMLEVILTNLVYLLICRYTCPGPWR